MIYIPVSLLDEYELIFSVQVDIVALKLGSPGLFLKMLSGNLQ